MVTFLAMEPLRTEKKENTIFYFNTVQNVLVSIRNVEDLIYSCIFSFPKYWMKKKTEIFKTFETEKARGC